MLTGVPVVLELSTCGRACHLLMLTGVPVLLKLSTCGRDCLLRMLTGVPVPLELLLVADMSTPLFFIKLLLDLNKDI